MNVMQFYANWLYIYALSLLHYRFSVPTGSTSVLERSPSISPQGSPLQLSPLQQSPQLSPRGALMSQKSLSPSQLSSQKSITPSQLSSQNSISPLMSPLQQSPSISPRLVSQKSSAMSRLASEVSGLTRRKSVMFSPGGKKSSLEQREQGDSLQGGAPTGENSVTCTNNGDRNIAIH